MPASPAMTRGPAGLDEFFAALFTDMTGLVELRALPSRARDFVAPHDAAARRFVEAHAHEDLYFGVAARRDATSGALGNCSVLGAAFVDLDFKQVPDVEARRRLAACPAPPSVVVASGGGLHLYWLLREPLDVQADEARIRRLLVGLAQALGGDRSAAEPARILRVPYTKNYKYMPARPVAIERCDPVRRYTPDDLEVWLPAAEPARESAPGFHAARAPVPEGGRRTYLFRLARSLRAKGFSEAAALAAAQAENAATCAPPLPPALVVTEVHKAFARADRPEFGAPGANGHGPARADRLGAPVGEPEWPSLPPEALHGLAGRVVEAIAPHSEADPVATLMTFLVAVGNAAGPQVRAAAGEDAHPARLFVALVGPSSRGRKGMSWSVIRRILSRVDEPWARTRVASGLSSGEGLIYHVRDPREESQAIRERGRVVGYETVMADPGVLDKRLLIEEPELASALRRMDRESNSLSAVLRQAWDGVALGTLTKNSPLRAAGAHVSLLAHVTPEELVANLGDLDRVNGFANRFLFMLVRRARLIPDPRPLPEAVLSALGQDLAAVLRWATEPRLIARSPSAAELWGEIYADLSAEQPGLLGAVLARSEAHVLRLSTAYALLDCSPHIEPQHLAAALAVWAYAEQSAHFIFGDRTGDGVADRIEAALRERGPLSRTALRDLFQRHVGEARIEAALRRLEAEGRARPGRRETAGRPAETWEVTR